MREVFALDVILKLLVVLAGALGLYGKSGLREGRPRRDLFLFFTNVSVAIAVVFYLLELFVLAAGGGEGACAASARGAVVTYLLVVAAVFNLVLVPMYRDQEVGKGIYTPEDVLVHCATPALALLDWVVFPSGHPLGVASPIAWLSVPLVYLIALVVRERLGVGPLIEYLGSYYPYTFIARDLIGTRRMLLGVLALLLVFLAVGYFVWWIGG